jgi:hypothetical protein
MSESESLTLRSVTDRFNESADVLDRLRERIQSLGLAEETQQEAAETLRLASERLTELVAKVESVVNELDLAQSRVTESLEVARQFLEGTDLERLRSEVGDVSNRVGSLDSSVTERLEKLEQAVEKQLRSATADAAAKGERLSELESKVAALPDRTKRKAGLA